MLLQTGQKFTHGFLTDFHGTKLKQVDFKRVVRAVWVSATGALVDSKEANSDVTQPGWTSCHHS